MAELANIIDYNDFKASYKLFAMSDPVRADLKDFIEDIQRKILIDLLSEHLYIELVDNQDTDKYKTLMHAGDGYLTYVGTDGENHIYKGFKEMLANFVWFFYMKDNESYGSSTGNNKSTNINSEKASSELYNKSVRNWNRAVELYYEAIYYIDTQNNNNGSDYFPEFDYKPKGLINNYGI